jgi:hypothetical protein
MRISAYIVIVGFVLVICGWIWLMNDVVSKKPQGLSPNQQVMVDNEISIKKKIYGNRR